MGSSIAHVCGHLHTLGGFVPKMYGKHPSGHLELELGDFTYSKRLVLDGAGVFCTPLEV